MHNLSRLTVLTATTLFLLVSTQLRAATEYSKESTQARKVVEDYFEALNNSALEIIVSLYHKDSAFLPDNAPAVRGIDDIRKAYRNLFLKIKLNTTHVYDHVAVYGGVAIVESHAQGSLTLLDSNKTIPSTNKELFFLRKVENQWKIYRYMFNGSK